MRGKSPLVITEMCLMLLVFAISAALCLGVFVLSDDISAGAEERDRASLLAQNCAEAIKAADGDLAAAAEILGADCSGEAFSLERGGLYLSAEKAESRHELLGLSHVSVKNGDGEELIAFDCPWQKGGGENG